MARLGAAALIAILMTPPTVGWAGLYVPGEEDLPLTAGRALSFDQFQALWTDQIRAGISLPNSPDSALRKRYQNSRDELRKKNPDRLSEEEVARLSGYHLRLNETAQAFDLLKQSSRRHPRSFLVHANLAQAALSRGELLESLNYQDIAISLMRGGVPGMKPEQVAWYQRCEMVLRDLLRKRLREQRDRKSNQVETVDAIFESRFVGASGEFEVGAIDEAERSKLPADALAVVQQLLFWSPHDNRLYWLLGELYNATGDTAAAQRIFNELVDARGFQPAELLDRRRRVNAALTPPPPDHRPIWIAAGLTGAIAITLFILKWTVVRRR